MTLVLYDKGVNMELIKVREVPFEYIIYRMRLDIEVVVWGVL